ncbi:hypothetical protein BJ944DRAFT_260010 [Cunninghamella echinulata]|nr:hypothetical protein BJ944DRAFT_260010 [Cunninghamella echinulata]
MDNKGQHSYPPPPSYGSPQPGQANAYPPQNASYAPPQNASYGGGGGYQQPYQPYQQTPQQHYQQPQYHQQQGHYQAQAPPNTVYVQQQPNKSNNDAMCMGCLAALCFCCAMDAIF